MSLKAGEREKRKVTLGLRLSSSRSSLKQRRLNFVVASSVPELPHSSIHSSSCISSRDHEIHVLSSGFTVTLLFYLFLFFCYSLIRSSPSLTRIQRCRQASSFFSTFTHSNPHFFLALSFYFRFLFASRFLFHLSARRQPVTTMPRKENGKGRGVSRAERGVLARRRTHAHVYTIGASLRCMHNA